MDAQDTHLPMLTLREMGVIMNTKSTSYVQFILNKLVAEGLAIKERRGLKHVYRFVPQSYKHNPQAEE